MLKSRNAGFSRCCWRSRAATAAGMSIATCGRKPFPHPGLRHWSSFIAPTTAYGFVNSEVGCSLSQEPVLANNHWLSLWPRTGLLYVKIDVEGAVLLVKIKSWWGSGGWESFHSMCLTSLEDHKHWNGHRELWGGGAGAPQESCFSPPHNPGFCAPGVLWKCLSQLIIDVEELFILP